MAKVLKVEQKKERLIADYLAKTLALFTGDSYQDGIALIMYVEIILKNIEITGIADEESKFDIIQSSIFEINRSSDKDLSNFVSVLNNQVECFEAIKPTKHYVIIPVNIAEDKKTIRRAILGAKLILFPSWIELARVFNITQFMNNIKRDFHLSAPYASHKFEIDLDLMSHSVPLLAIVWARSENEAVEKASRASDLFRALLNLARQYLKYYEFWGNQRPKPLGDILPPPAVGVFNSERVFKTTYYGSSRYAYEYTSIDLKDIEITQMHTLVRIIGKPSKPDDTRSIMLQALKKYGQALDTVEYRLAFLALWQIIELIALDDGKTVVVSKIKNLIKDETVEHLLNALVKTRNSLVHQGAFPDLYSLNQVNG